MASITITNNSITVTGNSLTVNYTTDVTLDKLELTKDGTNYITASTYSQNSATFNISSWANGTYSDCKLRVTYEVVNSYGQIVLSISTVSLNEAATTTFNVKLDKAPTSNQVVNLSVNNSNCSINKTSLTFTPSNYSTNQSVTITGTHDTSSYVDKSSTITASSDNVSNKTINVTIKNIDTQPTTPNPPSSGSALDDWDAYNNTYGNYVAYMADRVGVKGKSIRMTATATPTTVQGSVSKDYRSGAMVSKKAYKYGTFIFKFKISANNTLLWPMIWTLPDQTAAQDQLIGKNQRPEYDLLESWGAMTNNSVVQTYHCTTPSGESKMNYLQGRTPTDLTQEHTLKLVWAQDNTVKMYCDGVLKVDIKDYVTNWQTGQVDYQVWFLNLGLGGFDGTAPNGVGWFEITDYDFQPVYTRDRVKQDYGFGSFSDGTLPSGPLPSSSGSSGGGSGDSGGSSGGDSGGDTGGDSDTLTITAINVLSSTEASTQINYTTNKPVTKHYFNMWYSGADSGFTDGTTKVTDNGNNNYTMTFTNELSAGTKSPAIKVEDTSGNTYIKTFSLTVTS